MRIASRRYAAALAVLTVLLAGSVSGCARVLAALAVQPSDTVSGEIVIAAPSRGDADTGPPLTIPPDLAGSLQVTPYRVGEYVGSRLLFEGLAYNQFNSLGTVSSQAQGRYQFNIHRIGDRVLISGRVDLTSIAVDKSDFQLKISFPGSVVATNGSDDAGTVSWTFTPGQVNEISATVTFDDPQAPSLVLWTLIVGGVVAVTVLVVVLLARRNRNPPAAVPGAR